MPNPHELGAVGASSRGPLNKPELSVVTEPLPKSQVGLTIEVPAELVDATFERVLNRLVSKAKIEGFRPGRAPRQLVEARVGPAALREEVVDAIVPQVVQQAMRENSIDPIDNPDVEVIELERGRPARLKATISVMPQVTLGDTSKLIAPAEAIDVTDEMLERRLEDVREPLAEVTPVEREARMGDVAVIDVEVEADGAVVDSSQVEVPEALVERELVTQLESMERSLGRQGLKLDRYLDYLGKTVPQWAADERPDAEARLKVDLILDEFARREGIDPTDEEVDTFLEEQAPRDEDLKGRVAELKQSASAKRYFASRLRRLKVLDRLNEIGIAAQPSETEAAKS